MNDRAFIPAAASPQLYALIAAAPAEVARCLVSQRGLIAGRNSCEGPWTQTMQLRVNVPGRVLRLPPRVRLGLQMVNPLGALDRALNGTDGLRGWGTGALPNQVLVVSRGFNTASNAFRYDVNPRFGETRSSRVSRPFEPYGVTLDVQLELSVRPEVQELQRQMKPARRGDRRAKLSSDSLMARYQRSMPSLYVAIQSLSDTLLLTPTQQDSLVRREARYRATLDSIYRPLVDFLAALPDTYDGLAALKEVQRADSAAWGVTFETGASAKAVLSPVQLTILPEFIRRLVNDSPDFLRRTHTRCEMSITPQGSSFSINRR